MPITLYHDRPAPQQPVTHQTGETFTLSFQLAMPQGAVHANLSTALLTAINKTTGETTVLAESCTITDAATRQCSFTFSGEDTTLEAGDLAVFIESVDAGTVAARRYPQAGGELNVYLRGDERTYDKAILIDAQQSAAESKALALLSATDARNLAQQSAGNVVLTSGVETGRLSAYLSAYNAATDRVQTNQDRARVEDLLSEVVFDQVGALAMVAPTLDEVLPNLDNLLPVRDTAAGVTRGVAPEKLLGAIVAEAHGLAGDGVHRPGLLEALLDRCRAQNRPLRLAPGTTRHDGGELNLSGVPAIIGEGAVLDLRAATSTYGMRCEGSVAVVATALALSENQVDLTVPTGLHLDVGDRIYFVSDEQTPNNARAYYYLGEDARVGRYDSATGALTLQSPLAFSYAAASLVQPAQRRLMLGSGVRILGPSDGAGPARTMIYARYADVRAAGVYDGWSEKVFQVSATDLLLSGVRITSVKDATANGFSTEYGVSASDLSVVLIHGGEIAAGRHAISLGGGTFNLSDFGLGSGSAAYPSVCIAVGAQLRAYATNPSSADTRGAGAVDAHGSARLLVLDGCHVQGGVTSAAHTTLVTGSRIEGGRIIALHFGDDKDDNLEDGSGWGYHHVVGCTIDCLGSAEEPSRWAALWVSSAYTQARLYIRSTTINGYWVDQGDGDEVPISVRGKIPDLDLHLKIRNRAPEGTATRIGFIDCYYQPRQLVLDLDGVPIRVTAKAAGMRLRVAGESRRSPTNGLEVYGGLGTEWEALGAEGFVAERNGHSGVLTQRVLAVHLRGGRLADNGVAEAPADRMGLRAILTNEIVVESVDFSSADAVADRRQYQSVRHVSAITGTGRVTLLGRSNHTNATNPGLPIFSDVGAAIIEEPGSLHPSGARRLVGSLTTNPATIASDAAGLLGTVTVPGLRLAAANVLAVQVADAGTGTGEAFAPASLDVWAVPGPADGQAQVYGFNRTASAIDLRDVTIRLRCESA